MRRGLDLTLLSVAFWVANMARFDWMPPDHAIDRMLIALPFVVLGQYLLLRASDVTVASWRYTTLVDVGNLVRALTTGAAVLGAMRTAGPLLPPSGVVLDHLTSIPYGVIAMDLIAAIVALAGARAVMRAMVDRRSAAALHPAGPGVPTLLVGAGGGGLAVVRALLQRPDLGIVPVGFVDDDRHKLGITIHRVPVLGSTGDLAAVIERHHIGQVLLTISQPAGDLVRRITEICRANGVTVRTIPGLTEIADGKVNLSRIRPVQLEDLLRRRPVRTDTCEIADLVAGQAVLVTGAGGSIGSELCRQLLGFSPARLVMVERTENALYEIDLELAGKVGEGMLVPCVADITDHHRIDEVLQTHRPTVVFHAAAHKHVPMMEHNPGEAIKNNVLGTQVLVDACVRADVQRFVLISTDKAVNPTSVMGASKRVAERYVMAAARQHQVAYGAVRFGNVLGSNGSVVPRFRRQLAEGGPLTVTHPDVKRFFMTIPEAVQLVLQTAVMGCGGEIFVLDMGEQIRILDLARDLIQLSGLREGVDVELEFTGLRPGEKLFEELGLDSERVTSTTHPKIRRWLGAEVASLPELQAAFSHLELDLANPRAALKKLVPEYQPTDASQRQLVIELDRVADGLVVTDDLASQVDLPR
ncbi:MAG TPA: nucleoside-diphosphate sugar epimerase/dehydratase [Euzebya sp.]|nr:nucleoside-diphosphate sugar epimerase/dehydratase [Euzebya sp.]